MSRVTIRFYAELNDLLPSERRQRDLDFAFDVSPTVKDAIESFGVPHVEVDLILVNGNSVGFDYRLGDGDLISAYPVFESLDIGSVVRLRDRPLRDPAFVADVHLQKLARNLRLLGIDVLHSNTYDDAEIIRIAGVESRIILTRDRQLLKHGDVTHGYWVRSTDSIEQAKEIVKRFDLTDRIRAFSRCLSCNGLLSQAKKADVLERIPPKTAAWLEEYFVCSSCRKLFWRGTHYERLERLVERICFSQRET